MEGGADLKEFSELKSLNAYNNSLESIEFLNSLPNKNKITKLNFYGNKISEVDFHFILTEFPKLETLNIENNPVKATNLQKLSNEQINFLIEKIYQRKFKVNAYKGSVLMDLLFYIKGLIKSGDSSQQTNLNKLEQMVSSKPAQQNSPSKKPSSKNSKGMIMTIMIGAVLILVAGIWSGQWLKGKLKSKYDKKEKNFKRNSKKSYGKRKK